MTLESNCTLLSADEMKELERGARPVSYARLVGRIRKEIPDLYLGLLLNLRNPYAGQCRQTGTHYILVHSSIEYFIRK